MNEHNPPPRRSFWEFRRTVRSTVYRYWYVVVLLILLIVIFR